MKLGNKLTFQLEKQINNRRNNLSTYYLRPKILKAQFVSYDPLIKLFPQTISLKPTEHPETKTLIKHPLSELLYSRGFYIFIVQYKKGFTLETFFIFFARISGRKYGEQGTRMIYFYSPAYYAPSWPYLHNFHSQSVDWLLRYIILPSYTFAGDSVIRVTCTGGMLRYT